MVGGASSYLAYLIFRSDLEADYVPTVGLKYVSQRPAPLAPGTTYFGRASVGWPLSWVVTEAAVRKDLTGKGFTGVQVWTDANDLPASWPEGERIGNVFVEATYAGTAPTLAVPAQVTSIWST